LTTLTLSPRAWSNPTAFLTSRVMSSISAWVSARSTLLPSAPDLAHVVHQHRHRHPLDAAGGLARVAHGAIDLVIARQLLGGVFRRSQRQPQRQRRWRHGGGSIGAARTIGAGALR
jgi:hypothetical protein